MAFHVPSTPATSYETPGVCLFLCTFATDADLLELWHPKQQGCEDDASTDAPIRVLLKQAAPATGLSILVLAAVEYIDGLTAHPTQHVRHYVKDHFLQRIVSGFQPSSLELVSDDIDVLQGRPNKRFILVFTKRILPNVSRMQET